MDAVCSQGSIPVLLDVGDEIKYTEFESQQRVLEYKERAY